MDNIFELPLYRELKKELLVKDNYELVEKIAEIMQQVQIKTLDDVKKTIVKAF